MIHGLSEYEKYRVLRPVIGEHQLDNTYKMPIIRNTFDKYFDWEKVELISFRSLSPKRDNSAVVAHMFRYDTELDRLWNHPLKYIPLFQTCAAVATPDFSLYPVMNINDIRHNVYRSRWLGCTWQNYGCQIIPTIGWVLPDTYDLCFSAVEEGCPVVVSTLGCVEYQDTFIDGFVEMKRRIKPSLIIVYGDVLPGITGGVLRIPYSESFARKSGAKQLRMPEVPRITVIKEAM